MGGRRLTLEDQQKRAALKGGKCLSTEFINNATKMEWQCSLGHTWWAMGEQNTTRKMVSTLCRETQGLGLC